MFRIKTLAFLIVVLSMVLAACQPAAPAATEPPAKKVWTYKDMTVGVLQTGTEGGWRAANTKSFKETATQLGFARLFTECFSFFDRSTFSLSVLCQSIRAWKEYTSQRISLHSQAGLLFGTKAAQESFPLTRKRVRQSNLLT